MTDSLLVVRGRQVVLPASIGPASIHIEAGLIKSVTQFDNVPTDCELVEADDDTVVMPGLVDSHVHINEPGRTEWEGFTTATQAAAAGGITTVVDMPLNSVPPTTTVHGLEQKLEAAREQCFVDVGFWGGVIPGNTADLAPLFDAGVVGFKCFLIHSGVDEFPNVTEVDLRAAMPELARLGAVLIVHAEVPGPVEHACGLVTSETPTAYETFLRSRPRAAEDDAIELMVRLMREFGTRVHIVHHSSANSLANLANAKAEGLMLTAETCPHYLTFAAEDIPDGATEYKCCPPIRERENREQLWRALKSGTIDMVVSDHSPCPPDMKLRERGDFLCAWGGISSLQLRLPIVWTEAQRRGHTLLDLTRWLCSEPAKLVGLERQKGAIAQGFDADVIMWKPANEFTVSGDALLHRHKLTPYESMRMRGTVEKTFLRGQKIYDCGELVQQPLGKFLKAGTALAGLCQS